jgi:DUF4097 and DUF4098 domain-containing protein YvlB
MTALRGIPAALAAAALLIPAAGRGEHESHGSQGRHGGASVSIDDGRDPVGCDDIRVSFGPGRRSAVRAEEKAVIPAGRDPLRIVAATNSGVRVRGTDRRDFEVLACKAAPTEDALAQVRLETRNGEVTVGGPSGGDWVGYLLVEAPRDAAIDVEATNGPIGLSELSGAVSARAENGPISIRNSPGTIDARAQNGPIHVRGDAGRVNVRTENGPIGVSLAGASWRGDGLEARAVNGPIHVSIPEGYASATVVESLGHSPWSCRGSACSSARRTDDDDRRSMELGSGPAVVRVSTQNGPVSIASGNDDDEDDE